MKKFIICPICEAQGKNNILGEIDEDGGFIIERHHLGVTKIIGRDFIVVCGHCNNPVYIKLRKEANENFTNWFYRFSRFKLTQGTIETAS
jgi:hypothetical protein